MSTPISRNNKLQGLDLYAPRRARLRSVSGGEAAGTEAPEQLAAQQPDSEAPQAEQPQTEQPQAEPSVTARPQAEQKEQAPADSERAATVENAGRPNDADETVVLDWVDQAIRAVIELEHATGGSRRSAARLEDAPSMAPAQDDGDEFSPAPSVAPEQDASDEPPPPPPGARRRDRAAVRTAPRRRHSLDPEIVPEPPPEMKRGGFLPLFVRLSLVIVFAAVVAYGLTALASLQPGPLPLKGAIGRVAAVAPQAPQAQPPARPPSRLIVEDQQAFANQPLPLTVNVADARQNQSVLLDGLAHGTTLSAGASASPSSWHLPSDRLRGLYLYAPKDFVGVMNTRVDLLGADQKLLDSRSVQFKWIAKEPKPGLPPSFATASAGPTAALAAKPDVPAIVPIDAGAAAMLMERGRDSLGTGDISAARVAFSRLADAGIADAALALAHTYDPDYLAAHNVIGVQGDRAAARALYQRAKQLGSAEAGRILAQMAGQ